MSRRSLPGQPRKIDREAFYRFLFKRANSQGKLVINQTELAEELALERSTVARIMAELVAQGKVKKIAEHKYRRSTYRIVDPEVWRWKNE